MCVLDFCKSSTQILESSAQKRLFQIKKTRPQPLNSSARKPGRVALPGMPDHSRHRPTQVRVLLRQANQSGAAQGRRKQALPLAAAGAQLRRSVQPPARPVRRLLEQRWVIAI